MGMSNHGEPSNPNFRERVTGSFAKQAVMKTLGVSLIDVRPGEVELEFPFNPNLTQQHGFIHAGIIATVLDSACGYAAFTLMPESASVLSVEFKVNLLSPARGERYRAIAKVKKAGRTITVAEGELIAFKGENKTLVATMTGTMMSIYDRSDAAE